MSKRKSYEPRNEGSPYFKDGQAMPRRVAQEILEAKVPAATPTLLLSKASGNAKFEGSFHRLGMYDQRLSWVKHLKREEKCQGDFLSYIFYLMQGGRHCPGATKECISFCLGGTGRMAFTSAHINKKMFVTSIFENSKETFWEFLRRDLCIITAHANRMGKQAVVRTGGLGEPMIELFPEGRKLIEDFPNIEFYTYTKVANRIHRVVSGKTPRYKNFHYCWSNSVVEGKGTEHIRWSQKALDNRKQTLDFLNAGSINFASVIFYGLKKDEPMPKMWNGFKVWDGQVTDHFWRCYQKEPIIWGLPFKGNSLKADGTASNVPYTV